jgi:hypothetical protein
MDHTFATGGNRARQFSVSGLDRHQLNALALDVNSSAFADCFDWLRNSHPAFKEWIRQSRPKPGLWQISGSRRSKTRANAAIVNGGLSANACRQRIMAEDRIDQFPENRNGNKQINGYQEITKIVPI